MRKWTTSACVVLAVGLAALLAVAGYRTSSSHPAQANTSIATSTTSSTSSTSTEFLSRQNIECHVPWHCQRMSSSRAST